MKVTIDWDFWDIECGTPFAVLTPPEESECGKVYIILHEDGAFCAHGEDDREGHLPEGHSLESDAPTEAVLEALEDLLDTLMIDKEMEEVE